MEMRQLGVTELPSVIPTGATKEVMSGTEESQERHHPVNMNTGALARWNKSHHCIMKEPL